MEEQLIDKVLKEVMKRVGAPSTGRATPPESKKNNPAENANDFSVSADLAQVTEFVGVSMGDTMGIVIANLDPAIHELLEFDKKFKSIGCGPPADVGG
jgi:hypothetical protein